MNFTEKFAKTLEFLLNLWYYYEKGVFANEDIYKRTVCT